MAVASPFLQDDRNTPIITERITIRHQRFVAFEPGRRSGGEILFFIEPAPAAGHESVTRHGFARGRTVPARDSRLT